MTTPTILSVFKSRLPALTYLFGNGKPAIFVHGVYRTANAGDIEVLKWEIAQGHPHIWIDPNEAEISSDMVDPMAFMRAKIIAEYLAKERAALDTSNDRGTSDASKLMPATTPALMGGANSNSGAPAPAVTLTPAIPASVAKLIATK